MSFSHQSLVLKCLKAQVNASEESEQTSGRNQRKTNKVREQTKGMTENNTAKCKTPGNDFRDLHSMNKVRQTDVERFCASWETTETCDTKSRRTNWHREQTPLVPWLTWQSSRRHSVSFLYFLIDSWSSIFRLFFLVQMIPVGVNICSSADEDLRRKRFVQDNQINWSSTPISSNQSSGDPETRTFFSSRL